MGESLDRSVREERYNKVLDCISQFEGNHGHEAAFRQLLEFMIQYLSQMINVLPVQAKHVLDIASRFKASLEVNKEIEDVRSSSWRYLSSMGSQYDFHDKENCAIRAALCLVHREPPTIDLVETCHWFLVFAGEVEDHSASIDDFARKVFFPK